MAKTFEDLEVWREARKLTNHIYKLSGAGKFAKDYDLVNQMRRASVSVMSNIAEGFVRGGNKEFVRYLFIARGSLAEVNSLLYVAEDLDYISRDQFRELNEDIKLLSKRVMAFIKSVDTTEKYERKQNT